VLRRTALTLLAIALLVAASAQSAVAAPPPTLTGQRFFSSFYPYGSFHLPCTENSDDTITYSFSISGSTAGPYAGTFTESGTVVVRSREFGTGDLVSLRSEFTIDSPSGQLSGTMRLPAEVKDGVSLHSCAPPPNGPYLETVPLGVRYSATITTPGGVFADRGVATTDFTVVPNAPSEQRLEQNFSSDLSSPEQQGSILLGKRTRGGSRSAMSANAKRASPFTLYFPATVRKLHAYVDGKVGGFFPRSGSQTVRGVIYAHGPGGTPGALLGRTFQFTVPAGMPARWLELYLAPPIRLNPGVYWLGLHSGGPRSEVAHFTWDPLANSRRFNVDNYADGPSNPFGSAALDNQQMSIFASGSY
jgi:hypothetical protein